VIAGTIDSITSAVGTGALGPTDGSVIIGTTSVMVSHIGEHRGDLRPACSPCRARCRACTT
jgi:sugar (pentulose or hexulose) kinase